MVSMSGHHVMSLAVCQGAYDQHAAEYARLLDPTLAGVVERLVELAEALGARVLDLATGTGALARAAARRGATVVGPGVERGEGSGARPPFDGPGLGGKQRLAGVA